MARWWWLGVGGLLAIHGGGCAPDLVAGAAEGGSTSTSAGGAGGAGGLGGVGGTGGAGGMGGAGGAGGQGGVGGCADLGDAATYGDVQAIALAGSFPQAPRSILVDTQEKMVFVATNGANQDIGQVTGPPFLGAEIIPNTTINTAENERGPVLLPPNQGIDVGGTAVDGALVYDAPDGMGARRIWASTLEGTDRAQVDLVNGGLESYSIAIAWAMAQHRYWYMSYRAAVPLNLRGLVTRLAGDAAAAVPVVLTLPNGCQTGEFDVTPWATPNGEHLLFNAPYDDMATLCTDPMPVTKSFYVKVEPTTGQPTGPVIPISIPEIPVENHVITPSLSPDACTLYFASDHIGGVFQVYSATRIQ